MAQQHSTPAGAAGPAGGRGARSAGGAGSGGGSEREWLTVIEVARHYGVSDRRVRQLLADGRIPGTKWGRDGKGWRVSRRWVEAQHGLLGAPAPGPKGKAAPAVRRPAVITHLDEATLRRLIRQEAERGAAAAVTLFTQALREAALLEASGATGEAAAGATVTVSAGEDGAAREGTG
jgi:excisionase family DNA binding protein